MVFQWAFAVRTVLRIRNRPAKAGTGRVDARTRPTLTDRAHAALKNQIIAAKYLPGQFLQEARICDDLKMGRTPVRQALHRLHQEGLLDVIHRKGVIVRTDSLPELLLAIEARILVEPFCAARCAERAQAADIKQLESLHRKYIERRESCDRQMLMEIDRMLHQTIGETAGNKLLLELLRPIQERMMRLWFLPHWQINDFSETASEHEILLTAIRDGRPEAAADAMRQHLTSIRQRIMSGRVEERRPETH